MRVDERDEGEDRCVLVVGRPINQAVCKLPYGATHVLRILSIKWNMKSGAHFSQK